jgi:tRNA/rRNA methyltransferase/tRNA (cytidine32/uridine32-2'-O)-methyltransferase
VSVRIILVGTTHPGNIGAARAMKNMGLHEMVLVNPRCFPHDDATARASGAEDVLQAARVVESLGEALQDCTWVAGASARSRTIGWPAMAPRECAAYLVQESARGIAAVVFGRENSGLTNEELDHCNTLLTIPTDSAFRSLNLAMAVQVLSYEFLVASALEQEVPAEPATRPATGAELGNFYRHLEQVLTRSRFLDPENPRLLMRRLRRLFAKAEPDQNEVNILRGILTSLDPADPEDQRK